MTETTTEFACESDETELATGGYISMEDEIAKHYEYFYTIDYTYLKWLQINGYINEEIDVNLLLGEYVGIFNRTEDGNTIGFMDYYGIPDVAYITYWTEKCENQIKEGVDAEEFDKSYEMELKFDAWFNFGLPADQDVFLNLNYKFNDPKSVMFRDPDDTVHTDRYFTINGFLIEFVGYDKYMIFEEKYANTPNYNIFFFINYFNISKEDFEFIFSDENNYHSIAKPYKTENIYGDDDMQILYFERHSLSGK